MNNVEDYDFERVLYSNENIDSPFYNENEDFVNSPIKQEINEIEFEKDNNTDRQWKIIYINKREVEEQIVEDLLKVEVCTRNDEPSGTNTIAEKLYSSLRYYLTLSTPFNTFLIKSKEKRMVCCNCSIVFSNNLHEEITNSNGNSLLDIQERFFLTCNKNTKFRYQTKQKLKINCVSYHFEKKKFQLKLQFFESSEPDKPILTLISGPFFVYSRRPKDQVRKKGKKRKRHVQRIDEENEIMHPKKKQKLDPKKEFETLLNRLVELKNNEDSQTQLEMVQLARSKLEIDKYLRINQINQNLNNNFLMKNNQFMNNGLRKMPIREVKMFEKPSFGNNFGQEVSMYESEFDGQNMDIEDDFPFINLY